MSIYATWLSIDDHDHKPECAHWEPCSEHEAEAARITMVTSDGRCFRWVPDVACTCGSPPPLVYQGSHVVPSQDGPRGGSVSFCAIPNFCHPSVRGTDADTGPPVDYARLWVTEDPATYGHGEHGNGAVVVLDRKQVERLRDTLTLWLETDERE